MTTGCEYALAKMPIVVGPAARKAVLEADHTTNEDTPS
jgi:hypothetical protein